MHTLIHTRNPTTMAAAYFCQEHYMPCDKHQVLLEMLPKHFDLDPSIRRIKGTCPRCHHNVLAISQRPGTDRLMVAYACYACHHRFTPYEPQHLVTQKL